jgi:hypothetical protein
MKNHVQAYLEGHLSVLVENVEEGIESPLKGYAVLAEAKKFIEQCMEQIKPIAVDAATRMGEKTFVADGYQFSFNEGARDWKYDHVKKWVEKKKELKEIEAALKANAEASQRSMSQLITPDGEILEAAKLEFKASSLSVKL